MGDYAANLQAKRTELINQYGTAQGPPQLLGSVTQEGENKNKYADSQTLKYPNGATVKDYQFKGKPLAADVTSPDGKKREHADRGNGNDVRVRDFSPGRPSRSSNQGGAQSVNGPEDSKESLKSPFSSGKDSFQGSGAGELSIEA